MAKARFFLNTSQWRCLSGGGLLLLGWSSPRGASRDSAVSVCSPSHLRISLACRAAPVLPFCSEKPPRASSSKHFTIHPPFPSSTARSEALQQSTCCSRPRHFCTALSRSAVPISCDTATFIYTPRQRGGVLSQPSEVFMMPNAALLELSVVRFTFSPPNHRSVKFVC